MTTLFLWRFLLFSYNPRVIKEAGLLFVLFTDLSFPLPDGPSPPLQQVGYAAGIARLEARGCHEDIPEFSHFCEGGSRNDIIRPRRPSKGLHLRKATWSTWQLWAIWRSCDETNLVEFKTRWGEGAREKGRGDGGNRNKGQNYPTLYTPRRRPVTKSCDLPTPDVRALTGTDGLQLSKLNRATATTKNRIRFNLLSVVTRSTLRSSHVVANMWDRFSRSFGRLVALTRVCYFR